MGTDFGGHVSVRSRLQSPMTGRGESPPPGLRGQVAAPSAPGVPQEHLPASGVLVNPGVQCGHCHQAFKGTEVGWGESRGLR